MKKKLKKAIEIWYIVAFTGLIVLSIVTYNKPAQEIHWALIELASWAILLSTGVCSLMYKLRQKKKKVEEK